MNKKLQIGQFVEARFNMSGNGREEQLSIIVEKEDDKKDGFGGFWKVVPIDKDSEGYFPYEAFRIEPASRLKIIEMDKEGLAFSNNFLQLNNTL